MGNLTLRQYRLAKGISQENMAKSLDIHPNTYSEWEKNPSKISIAYALEICKILKVHPDFVIFLPENPTNM